MKKTQARFFSAETPAILALADGSTFQGVAVGALGKACGEVVFNTAMTGYQEILTDPSYSHQIVTFTHPHVGSTGINVQDTEGTQVHAAGLVIRDCATASSFRSEQTLSKYLEANNIVGISEIDTRRLTRVLREKGSQNGAIIAGEVDVEEALSLARAFPGLTGVDLAQVVSTGQSHAWEETEWQLQGQGGKPGYGRLATQHSKVRWHVVVLDFGVKHNILRMLAQRGCRLTVVPAKTPASKVLALKPDGVFLSNGPGDPAPCSYAIEATRQLIEHGVPTFGICLGHQLMALASGAKTCKMRFGHHGANHPVQDLDTRQVLITSQNHGFAVDTESLPANCRATHVSLFDGSLQGFERTDKPAFCFQGHPEASPGPHDLAALFDHFVALMEATCPSVKTSTPS